MSTRKWLGLLSVCLLTAAIRQAQAELPQPKLPPPDYVDKYLGVADPQRYMRLHRRISWHFQDWRPFAERIGNSGDAFTLFLLKQKVLQKLKPEDQELRNQIISRIEKQRGPNPDRLRVEEVGPLVENSRFADVYCSPLPFVLVKWLQSQFRDQIGDPRMRRRLLELRDELQKLPAQLPKEFSEFEEGLPTSLLRKSLDDLLSVNNDPMPGKK